MNEEITIRLTRDEIEELLHATVSMYMEYDERLFKDNVLQNQYNEGVRKYNQTVDNIRDKLKDALKNGKK